MVNKFLDKLCKVFMRIVSIAAILFMGFGVVLCIMTIVFFLTDTSRPGQGMDEAGEILVLLEFHAYIVEQYVHGYGNVPFLNTHDSHRYTKDHDFKELVAKKMTWQNFRDAFFCDVHKIENFVLWINQKYVEYKKSFNLEIIPEYGFQRPNLIRSGDEIVPMEFKYLHSMLCQRGSHPIEQLSIKISDESGKNGNIWVGLRGGRIGKREVRQGLKSQTNRIGANYYRFGRSSFFSRLISKIFPDTYFDTIYIRLTKRFE